MKFEKFKPLLLDLIRHGDPSKTDLIGGEPDMPVVKSSTALHEVGLGYQWMGDRTYVVARIRLFAAHGGPVYYAVVGESLESAIARFSRVVFSRISRKLAR